MKIAEWLNGRAIYREETPEEQESRIAAEREAFYEAASAPLTTERKLQLMMDAIPVQPQPRTGNRTGYVWRAVYSPEENRFGWEEVPDPYEISAEDGADTGLST